MSRNSCKHSRRQAFTLVEVITSVALLSTLLVGMLTAWSHHVRQINRASELQIVVRLTDDLLSNWYRDSKPISSYKVGVFSANPDFFWRLRAGNPGAERQIGGRILRLETRRTKTPTGKPILVVELLDTIPEIPPPATASGQ